MLKFKRAIQKSPQRGISLVVWLAILASLVLAAAVVISLNQNVPTETALPLIGANDPTHPDEFPLNFGGGGFLEIPTFYAKCDGLNPPTVDKEKILIPEKQYKKDTLKVDFKFLEKSGCTTKNGKSGQQNSWEVTISGEKSNAFHGYDPFGPYPLGKMTCQCTEESSCETNSRGDKITGGGAGTCR